jgi:CBS domain-containing protein
MEQALLTDQDNALVYADGAAADAAWFQALAARVNEDLAAAGIPRCPGGYMAYRWTGPLSEWQARFEGWIREPTPQALVDSGVFLDYRRVAGGLDLSRLERARASAGESALFLRALASTALSFRPPAGLVLRLRGESSTVDLKVSGLAPIVLLARCYGLEAGTAERGTVARIEAAARAGLLAGSAAVVLAETYWFLLALRLRTQLAAVADGRPPSDAVALSSLSGVHRSRLKDAFREIRAWQDRAAVHFQTNL